MQIAVLMLATFLAAGCFWVHVKYKSTFDEIISTVDEKLYPMPEMLFVGFGIMDMIHFDMHSKYARKRIHEIAEINGKKYAEYHFYVLTASEITYFYLVLTAGLLLTAIVQEMLLLLLGIILACCVALRMEQTLNNDLETRRDELLSEFPQVLSKLTLLVNSGMLVREAWNKVASSGEGIIYKEMKITMQEFQNGVTELDAYRNFADRCGIKEIRRFSSTMIQNMQKGNAEVVYFLHEMADELWEEKKHLTKRKGERGKFEANDADSPYFIGILIMIIVPIFTNI